MDQSEIQAWLDYCSGVSAEEPDISSIFYELFSKRLTEQDKDDIRTVLCVVPNTEKVLQRILQFDDIVSSKSNEEIVDLVKKDLHEMQKIIHSDKLIKSLDDFPIVLTIDIEYFNKSRKSDIYSQFYMEKVNYIGKYEFISKPIVKLLSDAFYGIAYDVNLQNVFSADLLHLDVNFDYYFRLRQIGVDYVLSDDAIVVMNYREKSGIFIP